MLRSLSPVVVWWCGMSRRCRVPRLTVETVAADGVTLRTAMDGVTVTATYDTRSGAMTAMTLDQGGYATTHLALASID